MDAAIAEATIKISRINTSQNPFDLLEIKRKDLSKILLTHLKDIEKSK
jgi:hypothetical protein